MSARELEILDTVEKINSSSPLLVSPNTGQSWCPECSKYYPDSLNIVLEEGKDTCCYRALMRFRMIHKKGFKPLQKPHLFIPGIE
jgi:hypothetical protein